MTENVEDKGMLSHLRQAHNEITLLKQDVNQKKLDIARMRNEAKEIQKTMRWFRDNYAYDTREAMLIELLLSKVESIVEIGDYSEIPF